MAEISLVVCDVCQRRDKPAVKYEVKCEERTATVDLCESHAAPLESILDLKSGKGTKARAAGIKSLPKKTSKLTSPEEIARQKKMFSDG